MSLLVLATFESDFPLWDKFCLDDEELPSETILQRRLDLADDELQQYITIEDTDTLPDWLKKHLFNIAAYSCFEIRHGDTEFQNKPAIVKNYEATIKYLTELRQGNVPVALSIITNRVTANASTNKITLNAKERLFGPGGGFAGYEKVEY